MNILAIGRRKTRLLQAVFGWALLLMHVQLLSGALVDGYMSQISADRGTTIDLMLNADQEDPRLRLPIFYQDNRTMDVIYTPAWPQSPTTAEPWKDGFGYDVTSQYAIPESMPSGVYYMGRMPLIVRDADKQSDIVVVHPTNTTNAYTSSGGKSLYGSDNAQTVSFLRPQKSYTGTRAFDTWIARQDYDYRYIADSDVDDYSQLAGSKLLILTGGAEYWTREARQNFDRFVAEGGEVLIVAGNTMNRPVAYDTSPEPNQLTELRDHPRQKAMWNDARFEYPVVDSISADFVWGGYGFDAPGGNTDLGWDGWKIMDDTVPYLAGTGLNVGDIIPNRTREYDAPPIVGFDPDTGFPIPDLESMDHHYFRMVAFDRSWSNWRGQDGYGAWFEYQQTPTSGRVIVVGSTNWTENYLAVVGDINGKMIDYLLAVNSLEGDFDGNGSLTVEDLDLLLHAIRAGEDVSFDLTGDQILDDRDRDLWVHDLRGTTYGDANLDGHFNSRDLVAVFIAALYEDPIVGNATWATGDWNGDGDFTTRDLVLAYQDGGYRETAAPAVPEPSGLLPWLFGCLGFRRKSLRPSKSP